MWRYCLVFGLVYGLGCGEDGANIVDSGDVLGPDVDGDGVLASDDCDDTDAASTTVATDGDCDGVLTEDDCDDQDDLSTVIAEDADCDGVLTADDCDDEDAMVVDTCVFCPGDFIVDDEDTIADVEAVGYCHTIEGYLGIQYVAFQNLSDFKYIREIGGDLVIANTDVIKSFDGFARLEAVGGSISARNNTALVNLKGLERLSVISGDLWVTENNDLGHLEGLPPVTAVGGTLGIKDNKSLTDISSVTGVTSVGGNLLIEDNPMLCQSVVEAFVSQVTVGGDYEYVCCDNDNSC